MAVSHNTLLCPSICGHVHFRTGRTSRALGVSPPFDRCKNQSLGRERNLSGAIQGAGGSGSRTVKLPSPGRETVALPLAWSLCFCSLLPAPAPSATFCSKVMINAHVLSDFWPQAVPISRKGTTLGSFVWVLRKGGWSHFGSECSIGGEMPGHPGSLDSAFVQIEIHLSQGSSHSRHHTGRAVWRLNLFPHYGC